MAKTTLGGKFEALKTYINKTKKSEICELSMQLINLGEKNPQLNKSKAEKPKINKVKA